MQIVGWGGAVASVWSLNIKSHFVGLHVQKAVLFMQLFFLLLTNAEITAFNWLKALFSPGVSKKKAQNGLLKRTDFLGRVA